MILFVVYKGKKGQGLNLLFSLVTDAEGNDVFSTNSFNEYFGNNQNNFADISRESPTASVVSSITSLPNNTNSNYTQPTNSPIQSSNYGSPQTNGSSSSLTPLQPLAVSSRGNFNPGGLQHAGGNAQAVGMW